MWRGRPDRRGFCGYRPADDRDPRPPRGTRTAPGVEAVDTDQVKGALAHARLSIIDLEGGWQPLHISRPSCTVIGNGEIYNYKELAEEYGPEGQAKARLGFRAPAAPLRPARREGLRRSCAACIAFCPDRGHDGLGVAGARPVRHRSRCVLAPGRGRAAVRLRAPRPAGRDEGRAGGVRAPVQELLAFNFYSLGRNAHRVPWHPAG